jgi:hypothetical protein
MNPWLWVSVVLIGVPPVMAAISATIMVAMVDRKDRPRVIARLASVLIEVARSRSVNVPRRSGSRMAVTPSPKIRSIDGRAGPRRRRAGRGVGNG